MKTSLSEIPPHTTITLEAAAGRPPQRLDLFLHSHIPAYSRTYFQKLITEGHVNINSKPALKSNILVQPEETVTITFPETSIKAPAHDVTELGISIVAELEHFLVINKPAGVVIHPPADTPYAYPTVIDWIAAYHQEALAVGAAGRPGIVHRLDRDTSGLMLIARTNYGHQRLGQLFQNRLVHKIYLAIVQGHPPASGTIDYQIKRHPTQRTRMTHCLEGGRPALTQYTTLEYFKQAALIEAQPVTGRTHQIRVHLAAIGHPLFGDEVYGNKSKLIKRHALHAHSIAFTFDEVPYYFTQEPPTDFKALIETLRATPLT